MVFENVYLQVSRIYTSSYTVGQNRGSGSDQSGRLAMANLVETNKLIELYISEKLIQSLVEYCLIILASAFVKKAKDG